MSGKNIFTKVKQSKVGSSTFDLSYDYKFTCNMGDLIPVHCQEVLPGDFFKHRTQYLLRMQALLAPIMHRVDVTLHHFYVPTRLLWDNWEEFITGQGLQNSQHVEHALPTFQMRTESLVTGFFKVGGLGDYLGLPANGQTLPADVGASLEISAFPFAAYAKIYNDYYRDQNVGTELGIVNGLVDGYNVVGNVFTTTFDYMPLKRAWEHDYFTSCLPWAQKGPAVELPVSSFADVSVISDGTIPKFSEYGTGTPGTPVTGNPDFLANGNLADDVVGDVQFAGDETGLKAKTSDLSATATSIRDLRRAFKLQEWLERNARAGTRYTESLMSHFGVKSSDARLNRAEYLGGSKAPAQISEVLQTSETTATGTPLATMAGHGVSVNGSKGYAYRCEEHGYIMTIMSVMPRTSYFQGLDRMWTRKDRYDYYWPSFQHIGEQAVLNQELYLGNDGSNEDTFGYIPRYSEYKFNNSRVSAEFRTTLDYWHMSRKFANRPLLNQEFIDANPTTRIFATEGYESHLLVQMHHSIKATRKMAKFANPGI